jgi:dsRNA-specific ribonuclease
VKTLARLKIKYGSTESYSSFAEKLGFWPYIKAPEEEKLNEEKRQKLMEDVFEAFIGVTKIILIHTFKYVGVGNEIASNIIESLLIDEDIPLSDEDLHDAKTRLKEFFDRASSQLRFGKTVYTTKEDSNGVRYTVLSFVKNNVPKIISEGFGVTKIAQEKDAAAKALEYLKQMGENVAKRNKLLCE